MKKIFLFGCLLLLMACQPSSFQKVEVDGLYSIEVPDFTKEVNHLNPDASLQYANSTNDFLVMVIADSKEEFQNTLEINEMQSEFPNNLDGITLYLQQLHYNIEAAGGKILHMSKIEKLKINELNAREYSIEAEIEGEKLYYLYTIVEGDLHYYQIMAWTYLDFKEKYRNTFTQMNHSFKEL